MQNMNRKFCSGGFKKQQEKTCFCVQIYKNAGFRLLGFRLLGFRLLVLAAGCRLLVILDAGCKLLVILRLHAAGYTGCRLLRCWLQAAGYTRLCGLAASCRCWLYQLLVAGPK